MKRVKIWVMLVALATGVISIVLMGDFLHLCPGANNITCWEKTRNYGLLTFPAVPIFLLSLFTYFLSVRLYKIWFIFSVVWAALITWVISLGTGGGSLGVVDYGGIGIYLLLALYFIVTIPFVLGSYLVAYLRRKRQKSA
jgi:hypothetical protein